MQLNATKRKVLIKFLEQILKHEEEVRQKSNDRSFNIMFARCKMDIWSNVYILAGVWKDKVRRPPQDVQTEIELFCKRHDLILEIQINQKFSTYQIKSRGERLINEADKKDIFSTTGILL